MVTHVHAVQFYESDRFLARVVAQYLADGLQSGAPTAAILTEPHRIAVEHELRLLGLEPQEAIARRQLKLCDASETLDSFMVGRRPDRVRFFRYLGDLLAELEGGERGTRPRAYGEMVDVLWKCGQPGAALELEELWNEAVRRRAFSLLCGYAMENFAIGSDSDSFDRVCSSHSQVIPTERFARTAPVGELHREIAQLQRRALALENEVARRKRSENTLRLREAELQKENDRLAAAVSTRDDFLAMLGHELRNPLAPILLAADLMRDRSGVSSEQEVIERQVMHLTRLVDDLLDLARLSRGKVVLQKRSVALQEVVAHGIELALPPGHVRRADLVLELPHAVQLEADPNRIAQVIANLLNNAAKYSDAGSPIAVSATTEGGQLELTVRDHGIGIADDVMEHVFERFVQQPQALERADGGLGLGLPIVRDIVQLHDGSVHASSAGPGLGTELRVRLPLPERPRSDEAPLPAGPRGAPVQLRRILIVDDNEDAAQLLAMVLERDGHSVAVAHESNAALALAPGFAPEIALLDLGLPEIDGYELAARLRARDAAVRLIAISGYGDQASRARSLAAGFEAHVVKPVRSQELSALLAGDRSARASE